ncbi:hypothetical protein COT75_02660 [Candidatus Beckwithbacteria bacterium CG10_big_fil_rev_8_21_14_0_10_34_10]|uniref:UDP-N-acetylglucosamine--N-acetylmuramyl-(pentapeptide) pyrophosphoryl-undecaprenol N-acetylglucosamine transferase n=1 Tax=Candidatus Beckwithbacteria bacterium CG10_big_fil_rev_8_21_14_0_10_34_10 TaxID=1974495 RepID=A0A2H0WB42_9BACT|nr:MAG: hypothetical protein COT75_02660 [Candidatus Beckwithbacteria bacterium CG10_big_fil_rev_8_21_14_0_10_34_10]
MDKKKIVFIGGHHNSALVVAKILKEKYKIYWFGHKHTMKGEKSLSLEYQEVKKERLPFFEIKTAKIYKNFNPFYFFKIILAFFQSLRLLFKIKPQLIISFGGYISFPVLLAGIVLRIDYLLHEQTVRVGLANRFFKKWAKKVLLTWPNSKKYFEDVKTQVIGLPLSDDFLKDQPINNAKSLFSSKLPVVMITGGKQGSHVINKAVENNLKNFLLSFNLIHQTGGTIKTGDYKMLQDLKEKLPLNLKQRYILKKSFFRKEMDKMIKLSDLIVGRSGAHIVYELAALGKPAVFIPLPWASGNEQLENAKILESNGSGLVLEQKDFNSGTLLESIKKVLMGIEEYRKNALKVKKLIKKDASQKMVEVIEDILN